MDDPLECGFCYEFGGTDGDSLIRQQCACSGNIGWVHKRCLWSAVDTSLTNYPSVEVRGNVTTVRCPVCKQTFDYADSRELTWRMLIRALTRFQLVSTDTDPQAQLRKLVVFLIGYCVISFLSLIALFVYWKVKADGNGDGNGTGLLRIYMLTVEVVTAIAVSQVPCMNVRRIGDTERLMLISRLLLFVFPIVAFFHVAARNGQLVDCAVFVLLAFALFRDLLSYHIKQRICLLWRDELDSITFTASSHAPVQNPMA